MAYIGVGGSLLDLVKSTFVREVQKDVQEISPMFTPAQIAPIQTTVNSWPVLTPYKPEPVPTPLPQPAQVAVQSTISPYRNILPLLLIPIAGLGLIAFLAYRSKKSQSPQP